MGNLMSGESPAVARRRLRLALRKAREAKGLTQGSVADALEWSISKVNRIEGGEVTVSGTDLRALLALYDVTDSAVITDLAATARAARQRGWWDQPRIREHLTPAMAQLLQFEAEATAIRVFHPTLVPGLLQTRAYAESILSFWAFELSKEDRAVRLEVRMRRREHFLNRRDPPAYVVVLDESVLHRQVGGARAMAEQLRTLLDLCRTGRIAIRVVPLDDAASIAMLGPFTIFDLGGDESAALYRESHLSDDIVQSPEVTQRHRSVFDRIWSQSLSGDSSLFLIEERISAMMLSGTSEPPSG